MVALNLLELAGELAVDKLAVDCADVELVLGAGELAEDGGRASLLALRGGARRVVPGSLRTEKR